MQAQAIAKYVRMSPRKVRLVVNLIRNMSIKEARHQLLFLQKDATDPVLKVLESAIANAVNNHGMKAENLRIMKAFVDEGTKFHRFTPRAQGRATPIRKRMSHITIVVGDEPVEVKAATATTKKSTSST
jgi:large subunit ribosomal protein L22